MNSIMETICAICSKVRDGTKTGLSFQKLLNKIRKEFNLNNIDLKIRSVRDRTIGEEVFYLTGYYDPEDDQNNDIPIELIITHNFDKNEVWYGEHSTQLLIQIFDTVVHELKHQRQFQKRKYRNGIIRSDDHKEYLADPDEIDAYAVSIAIELCRSLGKSRALRYLHNIDAISRYKLNNRFVSSSLSMYRAEFPEPYNLTMRSLTKKIYVRLMKVDTDCIFM